VAALELDGICRGGAPSQGDLVGLLQPLFFGAGFFQCDHPNPNPNPSPNPNPNPNPNPSPIPHQVREGDA